MKPAKKSKEKKRDSSIKKSFYLQKANTSKEVISPKTDTPWPTSLQAFSSTSGVFFLSH